MSTNYPFAITRKSGFRSGVLYTDLYDTSEPRRLYLALFPKSSNLKAVQLLAKSVLKQVPVEFDTYCKTEGILTRSAKHSVKRIVIEGKHARDALDWLLIRGHLSMDECSLMDPSLEKIERCLEYEDRVCEEITLAQKEIIESMVEPYVDDLKARFQPQVRQALLDAICVTLRVSLASKRLWVDKVLGFMPKSWPKATQIKCFDDLYVIGKVLTGEANLESALIQNGPALPNLDVQKRIVMQQLGLVAHTGALSQTI